MIKLEYSHFQSLLLQYLLKNTTIKSCGADIRIGIQIKRTELRVQKEMQISITNISETFRWKKKSPTEKKKKKWELRP